MRGAQRHFGGIELRRNALALAAHEELAADLLVEREVGEVRHRKIARWTWPLWMYVAVSGVVVYVMAVHMFPYVGGLDGG